MDNYKYYCEKCDYGADFKDAINKHNRSVIHLTGKRWKKNNKISYKCSKCDYGSSTESHTLMHKLNNHSTKEERKKEFKYYCDKCDIGTFIEKVYKKHIESSKHP